ncbi:YncE family protein [Salinarimonas soli]|uniref:YncE family protein n=1 Tax=Salinarimonas soli TaxID=1638099 RepID=A0A5B2VBU4_9HYPH|nr:YncE family protein [Salinarimonas soli]KAA2236581.1 YncE family protein [Salinarimonas soli]
MIRQAMLASSLALLAPLPAGAGQAPYAAGAPDIPVSARDRVYAAEQFSNTVSVIDPSSNSLLGVIRLGDPQPANLSPLYRGQVLVHGLGFSPDRTTLAVVSIASNAVSFIDTATNRVKHTTYVGRSPHEAFFTPDGREVWVSVRGEDYIAVLDGATYRETARIPVPNGPGMTIFSPDGRYAYVCSSFTPQTVVLDVATRAVAGRVEQASPFCPNIAAAPDGDQVWLTLKDVGKAMVFRATPPFDVLRVLDTGPITNHVNFARTAQGQFAYLTIGGLNQVKVFRTDSFEEVAAIPVGALPHGLWPSGDGTRVYVGTENGDAVTAIDTPTNKVVATIPNGQAAQALVYVPEAVPGAGAGRDGLQPLGTAASAVHLTLGAPGAEAATTVSLFDQGITQVLQAAVTGLEPGKPYALALASKPDGSGGLEPLAGFMANPAGAQIVNAVGPIRQIVDPATAPSDDRRYLVIVRIEGGKPGRAVQLQRSERP